MLGAQWHVWRAPGAVQQSSSSRESRPATGQPLRITTLHQLDSSLTLACRNGPHVHLLRKGWNGSRQAHRSPARHDTTVSFTDWLSTRRPQRFTISLLTPHSSVQQMQTYMQPVLNAARNPVSLFNRVASEAQQTTPQNLLAQVRGMSSAQWASVGVVAAEVIGFFSIGEIIGRFKLVGYRAKEHSGEH
jgi:hypothetical protein